MRAAQHPRVNSVGAHALSPTEWHPCRPAAEVEPQHLPHDHVEGDNDRHADQAATGIVCSGAAGMCCLVRRGGEPQRRQREIYDNGNSAAVLPYDASRNNVLLTRQIRMPIFLQDSIERSVETCAGKLDVKMLSGAS
jgi:hypothetical protein